jgi:SAM-dependent methyltransferase
VADSLDIQDQDGRRVVAWGGVRVAVPYSRAFLDALARHRRGRDLLDELLRSEHPPYIHDRLKELLRPHGDVASWRVLDYGCGMGGSSTCLARLGVGRIVGVDLVNDYAGIWRARLAEAGYPGTGTFVQAGDTATLPFREGGFDAVFLNGLVEHLTPEERGRLLKEALRLVRPGGHVFVTETPNRWFPRNSHTKLWASEWLPLGVAARLAARFGPRRDFPTRDRTAIYRTGMRGDSVSGIRRAMGEGAEPVATGDALATMEFLVPRNPLETSARKQRLGPWMLALTRLVSKATGRPVAELAPHLNLAFLKRP